MSGKQNIRTIVNEKVKIEKSGMFFHLLILFVEMFLQPFGIYHIRAFIS